MEQLYNSPKNVSGGKWQHVEEGKQSVLGAEMEGQESRFPEEIALRCAKKHASNTMTQDDWEQRLNPEERNLPWTEIGTPSPEVDAMRQQTEPGIFQV